MRPISFAKPRRMLVDPKSYELAEYFLQHEKGATDAHRQELAEEIQRAVEDYCGDFSTAIEVVHLGTPRGNAVAKAVLGRKP